MSKNSIMAKISREDVIVCIIFATIGLLIPIVVLLRNFIGIGTLSSLHINWGGTVVGTVFTVLAAGVCLLNFYLSTLVPWLYKRQHGSMADFRGVSGLPIVGGIFILCAGALMPSSVSFGIFLMLLYIIDGNGIPRFFVSIIQNGRQHVRIS